MLKKRLASLLSLALCASVFFSGTAYAAEPEEANEDYVVTYSAEEITDADTLLELALSDLPATISDDGITPLRLSDDDELTVDQLLERREYRDGHVEEDRASTNLAIVDENGVKATRETIKNGALNGSNTSNSTTAKATLYYSYYFTNDNEQYGGLYVKTLMATGEVTKSNLSTIPILYIECRAFMDYGSQEWIYDHTFFNVPVGTIKTVKSQMDTFIPISGYHHNALAAVAARKSVSSTLVEAVAEVA